MSKNNFVRSRRGGDVIFRMYNKLSNVQQVNTEFAYNVINGYLVDNIIFLYTYMRLNFVRLKLLFRQFENPDNSKKREKKRVQYRVLKTRGGRYCDRIIKTRYFIIVLKSETYTTNASS